MSWDGVSGQIITIAPPGLGGDGDYTLSNDGKLRHNNYE
jgi:hypothetical protein